MPNKLYTFKKYKLKVLMNTYPLESQPRYFMSFVGRNFQKTVTMSLYTLQQDPRNY